MHAHACWHLQALSSALNPFEAPSSRHAALHSLFFILFSHTYCLLSHITPVLSTPIYTSDQVDFSLSRAQADGELKLDAGQRIYLYVKPSAMMAYDEQQIDSAPLV